MRWFGWFRRRKAPSLKPPKEAERFRVRFGVEGRVQLVATESGTDARQAWEGLVRRRDVEWIQFWDGEVMRGFRERD